MLWCIACLPNCLKTPPDRTRTWRYASGKCPAPDGIRLSMTFRGERSGLNRLYEGRVFYRMNEGYFSIHDPANGGYPTVEIERGIIKRIEISAV